MRIYENFRVNNLKQSIACNEVDGAEDSGLTYVTDEVKDKLCGSFSFVVTGPRLWKAL